MSRFQGKMSNLASGGLKIIITYHIVSFTMTELLTSTHAKIKETVLFMLDLSDLTKQDIRHVKYES